LSPASGRRRKEEASSSSTFAAANRTVPDGRLACQSRPAVSLRLSLVAHVAPNVNRAHNSPARRGTRQATKPRGEHAKRSAFETSMHWPPRRRRAASPKRRPASRRDPRRRPDTRLPPPPLLPPPLFPCREFPGSRLVSGVFFF